METVNPTTTVWTRETGAVEKRDVWSAMRRGLRGRLLGKDDDEHS